jgi:uncharacterized protein (DUF2336 family)
LAWDEVLKIRVALASALKDQADAPPKIVGQLAKDIEREVSEPVLRYCMAISDEDLLEILKSHPASWAVQAIAARETVSENVSDAVIETQDEQGGLVLLQNNKASLGEKTLMAIVERAKDLPSWQKPLVRHKKLTAPLAKDLARFVDMSVRNLLLNRTDFDQATMEDISATVKRRLEFMQETEKSGGQLVTYIDRLIKEKKLTDELILDALATRESDFVKLCLARLNQASLETIEKILDLRAPKPVIAIVWRAGFSMRTALQIQKDLAKVQPKDLIYPKGGFDYPLEEKDLNWQLEFLGLTKR